VSKILETKLPFAKGEISPEIFNRLVRVLELSLNKVDVDSTLSVNEAQKNINKFQSGDIIWNLSTQQLQLWNGTNWVDLYRGVKNGVEGVSGLGKLAVSTNGNITVSIGDIATGYGTEQWYT
tara:strand:- start:2 stop:367 length:366 start_codon:yes stop_codon:yes gene_type:complete